MIISRSIHSTINSYHISRQEYWSGLPFPFPVDHVLSELSTMTCPILGGPTHHGSQFYWVRQGCGPCDQIGQFSVIVVFILSALWGRRIRGLWKLPDGRDRLRGKLGLVLMGGVMLSKSLIQCSVEGRGCISSLLFPPTWGLTIVEVMKIMVMKCFRIMFILIKLSVQSLSPSNSLRPHEPQHARPPCPSPTPGVYPNSCPLSWWYYLTISSSVVLFPSCLQSFPTSGSLHMSKLFTSGGQNIGVSASTSVLPMNTQDWFP